jgi:hypothetical protein
MLEVTTLNRTSMQIFLKAPYPSSPKSREALETHFKELDLQVLRKVVHNEQVDITTPGIIISPRW